MSTPTTARRNAGPTVVKALSTRTITWWAAKRLTPGVALTTFVVYGLPMIYNR